MSSVHIRPKLRVGRLPATSRPAEDGAGRHAAGGPGSDIIVNLPVALHTISLVKSEGVTSHISQSVEGCFESDGAKVATTNLSQSLLLLF